MKLIPDGEEAAREFSRGLTAAVKEFNRGLPAVVATLTTTALNCVACVMIVTVIATWMLLRSSREAAKVRSEAQSLSQRTHQQEADARSLTANLQYLRMWYGEDKEAVAHYWVQKIMDTAAVWQAKKPAKDVKVVIIDHERLWPVWDIVLENARDDKKLYDLLVSPFREHFTTGLPVQLISGADERRFVARDLKEAIKNADMIVTPRGAADRKDTFFLFIYADLRGPLGPMTVEPAIEISNALWLNGFRIIGSLVDGKPRYAISENSKVTLDGKPYFLREKISEEHLEDMEWHTVESTPSRPSKKSGRAIWRWFSFLCIVVIIVGLAQVFGAGVLIMLIWVVLYMIGKYQTEQNTGNNV